MEEQKIVVEQVVVSKPQGKGAAVAGFVLSLVALVFCTMVFGIVIVSVAAGGGMGLGYFWIVFSLLSVVLSAMGMTKLKKTGGKRGLAIAGLVIGLVATVWSIILLMGVSAAASMAGDQLKDMRMEIRNNLNN